MMKKIMEKELRAELCSKIFEGARFVFDNERKRFKGETPFSDCRIQEGYHDFFKISVLQNQVRYALYDLDFGDFEYKIILSELSNISKDDFAILTEDIAKEIEAFFMNENNSPFFAYKMKLVFDFEGEKNDSSGKPLKLAERTFAKTYFFENKKLKKELKKVMDNYLKEVFFNEKGKVKNEREVSILAQHLLDFNLMEYSENELIDMINQGFEVMRKIQNRRLFENYKSSVIYNLKKWKEKAFLPLYYDVIEKSSWSKEYILKKDFSADNVDAQKLDLYVFQAYTRIKYKDLYIQFAQQDLERASKELGSEKAKMYLKKGTGTLPETLIYLKDNDLECKANDVFARVEIKIKNETIESYRKALDYLMDLSQNGFPKSYHIKFSSKGEKQFLKIKGLAKSSTHRFFAQALEFTELHSKIEDYANVAMQEFEWYTDVEEGEKSCMTGSYAVFGLGLESEKYFPLVKKYLSLVDDEHQLVHYNFLIEFIKKWGFTEKSTPIICKGALLGQFDKPFKGVSKSITEEGKKWIESTLSKYDNYDRGMIKYMIFGNRK